MKKIWPFSFYLLYFGAGACVFPYFVLYYQSLGFTGVQIGILSAIAPLISLIGAPFWTGIADTTRRHKLIMSLAILAATVLVASYPFVGTFAAVMTLGSLFAFMIAPVNSLADSATMTMLGDQQHMYGRVRVGGTIGWGAIAPLAGIFIEKYGLHWAFWSYALLMFIGFLVSQRFVFSLATQVVSIRHGLRELFSNRQLVLFLSTTFVCGMALMSINAYLGAYMAELGMKKSAIGFALGLPTISEVPMLFFADRLLIRLKPRGLLILSMIATMVRLFLYAIFVTETGILVFQLINGFTFAALWVAGVSYVNEIAPPGLSATAQGVFGATVFGFGAAGGGLLGGILLERVGGPLMYAIFGALLLVALIVYILTEKQLSKSQHAET
jgi:PPP family 3-phenylpropionic acid transporter